MPRWRQFSEVSRAEGVLNLTPSIAALLATDVRVREQLVGLEKELIIANHPE
jgi:hypothetical protein